MCTWRFFGWKVSTVIGFGLGAGMAQAIGRVMIEKGMPPFVMFPQIFWATLALVLGISLVSAIIGIIKVSRVDAATAIEAALRVGVVEVVHRPARDRGDARNDADGRGTRGRGAP